MNCRISAKIMLWGKLAPGHTVSSCPAAFLLHSSTIYRRSKRQQVQRESKPAEIIKSTILPVRTFSLHAIQECPEVLPVEMKSILIQLFLELTLRDERVLNENRADFRRV